MKIPRKWQGVAVLEMNENKITEMYIITLHFCNVAIMEAILMQIVIIEIFYRIDHFEMQWLLVMTLRQFDIIGNDNFWSLISKCQSVENVIDLKRHLHLMMTISMGTFSLTDVNSLMICITIQKKVGKFTASKSYPCILVGKLKALVDPGWQPGVI